MAVVNGRIVGMGRVIAADGQGDLQVMFQSSQMSKAWYFDPTRNTRINKWSAYKPFRYNGRFPDLFTDNNSARRAAAQSVNFGLKAPTARQNDFTLTFGDVWTYDYPQQNIDPLRTQDFEGYWDGAPAPVNAIGDLDVYESYGDFDFGAYIYQNIGGGGEQIAWQDLPSIGSYYLCAIFSTTSDFTSGNLIAKTAQTTISQGGTALVITAAELSQLRSIGYKYYYLVARSVALPSGLQAPNTNSAYYIALPCPNNSNEVKGEFDIHAAPSAIINLVQVCNVESPTRAIQFFDTTGSGYSYIGPSSIGEPDTDYFPVPNHPYWLHVCIEVQAGAAAISIGAQAKIRLSQTFNSATGFSTSVNCDVRDENFNAVTQVTIPANTTKRVYLIASGPILGLDQDGRRGGAVSTNERFATRVFIYQNSTLIDGNTDLRVRNYI